MRKKILILGHNYVPHFIDIFNQYTRLFHQDKFAVTVAYLTGEPNEEVRLRTLAENVIFLNFSKKNIRSLKFLAIKKLLTICRAENFQLVICHRYKPTYIMLWVSLFHRIPSLIFVMHELKTMSSLNRQLLMACLYRKNMWLAGVSNAVRADIKKSVWGIPKDRIVTLYNAIDVELVEPKLFAKEEARKILNLPNNAFIFGNLARLVPNKDHDTLLRAFAKIKDKCPNAKLIIMGNGQLDSSLKDQAERLELSNDILFTGFIEDGFRYMKAFDCFVLSSIQEAFGRVLIEAMIAKLPIIATDVHGIPEVMGETGIVVPAKNINALSEAMLAIYKKSEKEREKVGQQGYDHMLNHFSIPAFQKEFSSLTKLLGHLL